MSSASMQRLLLCTILGPQQSSPNPFLRCLFRSQPGRLQNFPHCFAQQILPSRFPVRQSAVFFIVKAKCPEPPDAAGRSGIGRAPPAAEIESGTWTGTEGEREPPGTTVGVERAAAFPATARLELEVPGAMSLAAVADVR
eukprot:4692488-Prymnesium_polylepis.1